MPKLNSSWTGTWHSSSGWTWCVKKPACLNWNTCSSIPSPRRRLITRCLLEQRREFHHRVGEALEKLFADRKEQYLGLLAHHFEMAGTMPRSVDYLIQAGDQARLTDEHY